MLYFLNFLVFRFGFVFLCADERRQSRCVILFVICYEYECALAPPCVLILTIMPVLYKTQGPLITTRASANEIKYQQRSLRR